MEFQMIVKIAASLVVLMSVCLYVFYKFISLINEDYENLGNKFVESQSKES